MTTFEVIQRVQQLYSKGSPSDDSRLSNRHIYNKLMTVRSRLIVNQVKQKQKLSQWNYQTLPCVEMIPAPIHECACIPSKGCTVLKSKYPLPKILTDMNRHIIQSVSHIDGSYVFPESAFELQKNKKGNRFTAKMSDYYIRNGYLYVTHNIALEVITLTAVFGDPIEAEKYPSYCAEKSAIDCSGPLEKEFPIDHDMIDTLVKMASEELVLMFSQLPEDKISNVSDDNSPIRVPRGTQRYIE